MSKLNVSLSKRLEILADTLEESTLFSKFQTETADVAVAEVRGVLSMNFRRNVLKDNVSSAN